MVRMTVWQPVQHHVEESRQVVFGKCVFQSIGTEPLVLLHRLDCIRALFPGMRGTLNPHIPLALSAAGAGRCVVLATALNGGTLVFHFHHVAYYTKTEPASAGHAYPEKSGISVIAAIA